MSSSTSNPLPEEDNSSSDDSWQEVQVPSWRLLGTCTRCKKLKMKCVFPNTTGPCTRCESAGVECAKAVKGLGPHRLPEESDDITDSSNRVLEERNSSSDHNPQEAGQSQAAKPRLPGACVRCKKLKMKCVFPNTTDPCTRCESTGMECVKAVKGLGPSRFPEESDDKTDSNRVSEESNSSSDHNPQEAGQSQAAKPRLPGACVRCKKLKDPGL
ncbi:hypothetical protein JAAARDRAFT_32478 [Jaapia argillacea MUCL 33604]|uniref:Zn(2)-C6 fungal-type domain-containing protein n=1 Tax=Jaapia argillacea MUCL 33604 TaxID=933084 RepID=A0A067Q9B1_9AGAM|nr:hypothetical protein JAAARDRAFT_32478 [Jaapia argillacea MUCL 33604]